MLNHTSLLFFTHPLILIASLCVTCAAGGLQVKYLLALLDVNGDGKVTQSEMAGVLRDMAENAGKLSAGGDGPALKLFNKMAAVIGKDQKKAYALFVKHDRNVNGAFSLCVLCVFGVRCCCKPGDLNLCEICAACCRRRVILICNVLVCWLCCLLLLQGRLSQSSWRASSRR